VDGTPVGVIEADGAFQAEVEPGSHSIELIKDASKSKPVIRHFTEGQNALVPGPDLTFEPPNGILRFKVSPPDSRITVRLNSEPESQSRLIDQEVLLLPEGAYVVSVSAPGHASSASTIPLSSGGNVLVEVALKRIDNPSKPSPAVALTMADWDDPGSWTRDAEWYVHKSGDFVSFSVSPVHGRFEFTAMARKGRRLQWAVNRVNDKNYILYKLDKKYFERSQITDGKSKEQIKIDHNINGQQSYTLKIDISPERIEHSIKRSGNWIVIDSWMQPGAVLTRGKFGFVIPWRDEFAVSSFSFIPGGAH